MAFNGSKHFAPGELVSFLESVGARFGADANAYTSFDETVFLLEVPTDRPGLVEKGLTVLADFAGGWTLSKEEIERERGVVLEEWRLGQGANSRLQRLQFPVLMHGSRYAERLPIGDPDVIRTFDPARLRRVRHLQAPQARRGHRRRLPAQPGGDAVPFPGELAPGRAGAARRRPVPGRVLLRRHPGPHRRDGDPVCGGAGRRPRHRAALAAHRGRARAAPRLRRRRAR